MAIWNVKIEGLLANNIHRSWWGIICKSQSIRTSGVWPASFQAIPSCYSMFAKQHTEECRYYTHTNPGTTLLKSPFRATHETDKMPATSHMEEWCCHQSDWLTQKGTKSADWSPPCTRECLETIKKALPRCADTSPCAFREAKWRVGLDQHFFVIVYGVIQIFTPLWRI